MKIENNRESINNNKEMNQENLENIMKIWTKRIKYENRLFLGRHDIGKQPHKKAKISVNFMICFRGLSGVKVHTEMRIELW